MAQPSADSDQAQPCFDSGESALDQSHSDVSIYRLVGSPDSSQGRSPFKTRPHTPLPPPGVLEPQTATLYANINPDDLVPSGDAVAKSGSRDKENVRPQPMAPVPLAPPPVKAPPKAPPPLALGREAAAGISPPPPQDVAGPRASSTPGRRGPTTS